YVFLEQKQRCFEFLYGYGWVG
ncbi:hypothetical protein CP8484711_0789, partial [Chlamydia psittaci 84-8471/1]